MELPNKKGHTYGIHTHRHTHKKKKTGKGKKKRKEGGGWVFRGGGGALVLRKACGDGGRS